MKYFLSQSTYQKLRIDWNVPIDDKQRKYFIEKRIKLSQKLGLIIYLGIVHKTCLQLGFP